MYPDLAIIQTEPTHKGKTLDKLATNFNDFSKTNVCYPLEGEVGQTSDHKIVLLEALLPRPKPFSWEVNEYLQLTDKGKNKFKDLMAEEKWSDLLEAWPDQESMANIFHTKLDLFLNQCFSWKRVRRKTSDKPWISDALRVRMKKRKAVFWLEGRSELWKRLDKAIKKPLHLEKRNMKKT